MDLAGVLHAMKPLLLVPLAALAACTQANEAPPPTQDATVAETAAPEGGDRELLWGDTHVHTSNSVDAFMSGEANADIDSAYRYARGLPVINPRTGARIRIDRPLDFIVVADHAENLAISNRVVNDDPGILGLPFGQKLREIYEASGGRAITSAMMGGQGLTPEERTRQAAEAHLPQVLQDGWAGQVAAAERHNRPGEFTAMIGWEWTSAPNMRNLHRVVFTDAGGDTARQFVPFANWMSDRPEDLWTFLEETKARTGADFVAMPHNANLSDGRMFALADSAGNPFTAAYASRRAAWEPVTEITQYKGTSETHPALAPRDEFAGFELRNMLLTGVPTEAQAGSYVRSALLNGLAEERRIGANPFRLGVIGSTDTHTGFVSVLEEGFLGKLGEDQLPRERLGPGKAQIIFPAAEMSASGLAGVWADHNDRHSIFAAFRRREVYGTSGPRIRLRLFAGYAFAAGDEKARDWAAIGYRRGVPMGGQLAPSRGAAPALVIRAVKDPDTAGLDRVQVVKGWVDARGELHEKIFDVAWSGDRARRADGSLPPLASRVDVARARNDLTAGAAELTAFWRDPGFDPAQHAFYYVRVLQAPTLRHHVYDALALGIDPAMIDIPATIQERAWSSPVWYRP